MAEKRGFSIQPSIGGNADDQWETIEITGLTEGEPWDEFAAAYRSTDNGWFFDCSCWDAEDWPYWIRDENHLRELLDFMATEIRHQCKVCSLCGNGIFSCYCYE